MRAADAFRVSLHNMRNNKSRTVLTVLIVVIVSSLIMTICQIGISFMQNMTSAQKRLLEYIGTEYSLSLRIVQPNRYSDAENFPLTAEEIAQFTEIAGRHESVIGRWTYRASSAQNRTNFEVLTDVPEEAAGSDEAFTAWYADNRTGRQIDLSDITFADLGNFEFGGRELIRQGRIWTEEDNDSGCFWIGSDTLTSIAQSGQSVSVGDRITFAAVQKPFSFSDEISCHAVTYTLAGIYDSDAVITENGEAGAGSLLFGRGFLDDFADFVRTDSICLNYRPPAVNYDYYEVYGEMKRFVSEVNAVMEPSEISGEETDRFACDYVTNMQTIDVVNAIVSAVIAVLSLLILLLSVGSVANSIVISVDKNRRFLGLMRALGLNGKGVRRIVTFESLCMIVAGVVLGIGVLFALRPVILGVMKSLFSAMLGVFAFAYTAQVTISAWLPVLTAAVFFLLAMLFSRGSLRKIASQDVIAAVGEEA